MTQPNPDALSVKMEDAIIDLYRRKTLRVGPNGYGCILKVQADALLKRGLAVVTGTKEGRERRCRPSKVMSDVVEATDKGVKVAEALIKKRGGV